MGIGGERDVAKRHAVEMLLTDEEWAAKSDRWIAEKCAVYRIRSWASCGRSCKRLAVRRPRNASVKTARPVSCPERKAVQEPVDPEPRPGGLRQFFSGARRVQGDSQDV